MSSSSAALFSRLLDDAAMFPPGNVAAEEAVRRHRDYRSGWFGDLIGPLVVSDQQLAAVGRLSTDQPIQVSVVNTTGAGGLVSLAGRHVEGVEIVAVESALRDLDDLAANAARVVSAAEELDDAIDVFVEFPYALGWERAVETVEAAGLNGKIRTGGVEADLFPSATQLTEQLSILIEADLPFKATAGLHQAWPNEGRNAAGQALPQHGFVSMLLTIDALIEGADLAAASELLSPPDHDQRDRDQLLQVAAGWNDADAQRIRRRFRSFGCCGVTEPIDDLVTLGLIEQAS